VSTLALNSVNAAPWGQALLQDITLTLEPGAVLALAGPNGAGKSSLLRLISGDLPIDSGQLTFCGRPLAAWPARERAQRLGVLPQLSLLNFPYTVEEVVLLGRTPHSSGQAVDRGVVQRALELTDTLRLRDRLYTQLSVGEKQRTQLARVIAQVCGEASLAGSLLLLDEPTSSLDLAHQQQVLRAIRELAQQGCSVVLVIHDLNLAASIADQVLVLDKGRQAALGTPEQVFTRELFTQVFDVDVTISTHPQDGFPLITPHRQFS
jgi:iron complex transport system ATP-binding protein